MTYICVKWYRRWRFPAQGRVSPDIEVRLCLSMPRGPPLVRKKWETLKNSVSGTHNSQTVNVPSVKNLAAGAICGEGNARYKCAGNVVTMTGWDGLKKSDMAGQIAWRHFQMLFLRSHRFSTRRGDFVTHRRAT